MDSVVVRLKFLVLMLSIVHRIDYYRKDDDDNKREYNYHFELYFLQEVFLFLLIRSSGRYVRQTNGNCVTQQIQTTSVLNCGCLFTGRNLNRRALILAGLLGSAFIPITFPEPGTTTSSTAGSTSSTTIAGGVTVTTTTTTTPGTTPALSG